MTECLEGSNWSVDRATDKALDQWKLLYQEAISLLQMVQQMSVENDLLKLFANNQKWLLTFHSVVLCMKHEWPSTLSSIIKE